MSRKLRAKFCAKSIALALSVSTWAHAEVIDDTRSWVYVSGTSQTVLVAPAEIGSVNAYGHATVEVLGGDVAWLRMNDSSHANVSGGDISWIRLYDASSVRITGIEDLSWLVMDSSLATAEIVADNVTYSGGHLSGTWADGTGFSFWAVEGTFNPSHIMPSNITITAVPEPATWVTVSIGLLALVAGRKRSS